MSIRISKSCEDINVLSLSELTRKLDIPVSRMKKAVDEGVIHPLGTIARAAVVSMLPGPPAQNASCQIW